MAAAKGNQYAAKSRVWTAAIHKALEKRSRVSGMQEIEKLAERLLDLANEGELQALKELGDRLEGKAVQPSEIDMTADVNLREIKHVIVKPGD
jgi:hypothetical protein